MAAAVPALVLTGSPVLLILLPLFGATLLLGAALMPRSEHIEVAGLMAVLLLGLSAVGSSDGGPSVWQMAFGVLLAGYVGAWYVVTLVGGRRFIRAYPDVLFVVFLALGVLVWAPVGVSNVSWNTDLRSDLNILLVLFLYFPAREVVVRYAHGPWLLGGALIGLGVFASLSNMFRLYGAMTGATELYEIVDVRVSSGEIQIIGGLFLALLLGGSTSTKGLRVVLFASLVLLLAGLVLSKSRGPWLTAVLGLGIAIALMPTGQRGRAVRGISVSLFALVTTAWLFLGSRLTLIGVGLVRRLTSISSAASQDISLLNRYAETAGAWEAIVKNPILGYGWGAPVVRYDWILKATHEWSFVHNGYVWMWYHTGLLGLVLFGIVLLSGLRSGYQAARCAHAPTDERTMAAAATGSFLAFLILAFPSNPFAVLDQMLIVILTLAFLSGLAVRQNESALRLRPE